MKSDHVGIGRMRSVKGPNFFLVGAEKAGTTSLYRYLASHPQVYMSPIKEPNYFAQDIQDYRFPKSVRRTLLQDYKTYISGDMSKPVHVAYVREWTEYIKLFRKVDGEIAIGECSNSYLYSQVAAGKICTYLPSAKIIVSLRNPIERIFSQYLMDRRIGLTRKRFDELLDKELRFPGDLWSGARGYIEKGMYSQQLVRYYHAFPASQICVVLYDELLEDAEKVLKRVFRHLGVSEEMVPDFQVRYNTARLPRYEYLNRLLFEWNIKCRAQQLIPQRFYKRLRKVFYSGDLEEIAEKDRERLRGVYGKDIDRVMELTGIDVSHWLR